MRQAAMHRMKTTMLEMPTSVHSSRVRRVSGRPVSRSSSSLLPHCTTSSATSVHMAVKKAPVEASQSSISLGTVTLWPTVDMKRKGAEQQCRLTYDTGGTHEGLLLSEMRHGKDDDGVDNQ